MTTPQTTPELLACPFCGHNKPSFERTGTGRHSCIVACGNCGARHESSDEYERSGESWNTRARVTAAPLEGVSALFQVLEEGVRLCETHALKSSDTQSYLWAGKGRAAIAEYLQNRPAPELPQPLAPPPGYALVQLEPTVEMTRAAARWLTNLQVMRPIDKTNAINDAYRAMVAAAKGD